MKLFTTINEFKTHLKINENMRNSTEFIDWINQFKVEGDLKLTRMIFENPNSLLLSEQNSTGQVNRLIRTVNGRRAHDFIFSFSDNTILVENEKSQDVEFVFNTKVELKHALTFIINSIGNGNVYKNYIRSKKGGYDTYEPNLESSVYEISEVLV